MIAAERLAEPVLDEVGPRPVLLVGSRATGNAHAGSDYDLLVLLPTARIPFSLRPLRRVAAQLAAELGVDVSLNPFPASRLHRPESLFAWKIRREARVLWAPDGFSVGAAGDPPLTPRMRFSFVSSAALYLLEAAGAGDGRAHGVEKCLLHLAQLRLLEQGTYATSLVQALPGVSDHRLRSAAAAPSTAGAFATARELVLEELEPLLPRLARSGVLRVNARYVVLSALRRRPRLRAALSREAVDVRLMRRAIAELGDVDAPTPATRRRIADLLGEWPNAHPLGAQ